MTAATPSLQESFKTVHEVLRRNLPAAAAKVRLGLDPTRVQFYADVVFGHVRDSLEKNYATTAAVLGPQRFNALVEDHYRRWPPGEFELNQNAAAFRDHLAECAATGRHGVSGAHVDLAELEWQEFAAYVSQAQMPAPERLERPALNPALVILQLDYPVSGFLDAWREREAGEPAPRLPVEAAPETVLVLRHPETENALFVEADEALLFGLKVANDGLTAEQAAEAAALPLEGVHRILRSAADWGVILLPSVRDREPSPRGPST